MVGIGLLVFSISLFAAFLVTFLMIRAGLGDVPVQRSSHGAVTPSAGGVGVLSGLGAGMLCLSFISVLVPQLPDLPAILALSFFTAFVGLYDDLYSPPTALKFGVFIGIGLLLVYALAPNLAFPIGGVSLKPPFIVSAAGCILWVFVVINGVNFMDGANGLMPGCMVIAFLGLALLAHVMQAPQTFWLCLVSGAAWLGFLPWNFRRKALIFAGDIGALLAGFVYAAAVLLLINESGKAVIIYLGPLIILPFLGDILLTLLRRARAKQNILTPHREHLYQRAILSGLSHQHISVLYYIAFAACSGLAILLASARANIILAGFIAAIIICALAYHFGGKVWRGEAA